jgi:hypothetical protein
MTQNPRTKPTPMLTSAHHGETSGDPIQLICDQSNVRMPIPSPVAEPNS